MPSPRIDPREPPYPTPIAEVLAKYPQGPEGPIRLFRTLAHSQRMLTKIGHGGLLDKHSPVTMRQREIVILRTSYRRHTSYEWGIHVKAFANHVQLTTEQVADTCSAEPSSSLWEPAELLLMTVVDQLVDCADVTDETWQAMQAEWSTDQIFEFIALAGFYHMIAFFNNVLRVEQEPGSPQMPCR